MPVDLANQVYWKALDGRAYRILQQRRTRFARGAYRQQEAWLRQQLVARRDMFGRPLRVLDVGCGFGRLAHLCESVGGIEYFGYDSSTNMSAPLLDSPPASLMGIVHDRVKIADDLEQVFIGECFDVVLTVSVLIHNEAAEARRLLESMLKKVSNSGEVILIENHPTATSALLNLWHGGSWVHNYVDWVFPKYNVEVNPDILYPHGLYLIRPPGAGETSIDFVSGGKHRRTSIDQYNGNLGPAVPMSTITSSNVIAAHLNDSIEELQLTKERLTRSVQRLRKMRLTLKQARSEVRLLRNKIAVFELASGIGAVVDRQRPNSTGAGDSESTLQQPSKGVEINAPIDAAAINDDPAFAKVVHFFHKAWLGIRAAAGSLPGGKVAIPHDGNISGGDLVSIISFVQKEGFERAVVHGYSDNMENLILTLHKHTKLQFYCVWHGNFGQLVFEAEQRFFKRWVKLQHDRVVRRAHILKKNASTILPTGFRPMLLNCPPNIRGRRLSAPFASDKSVALIPGWSDVRKNVHSNIIAAIRAPEIDEVMHYAAVHPIVDHQKPIRRVKYDGASHLKLTAASDIVLNVTLIDCHPMVDLEALACGTPCLTGPLHLDALEAHPYTSLTTVDNPLDVEAISTAIARVANVPPAELGGMMKDYREEITKVSLTRYGEFLEL